MDASEQRALDAICQAYWWYKTFDEIELLRLNNGPMTADAARRIAKIYSVARNIPQNPPDLNVANYSQVAAALNALSNAWPNTLVGRAEACDAAAGALQFPAIPRSAFSKLMWFLKPEGWTLFDSYAARGAGIGGIPGAVSFVQFYTRLQGAQFGQMAANFWNTLASHQLPPSLAERIVDWALMQAGGRRNPCDGPAWTNAFLQTLAPGIAVVLRTVAREIALPLTEFLARVQNPQGLPNG